MGERGESYSSTAIAFWTAGNVRGKEGREVTGGKKKKEMQKKRGGY